MGKNDLFLAFYRLVKAIYAAQGLQKPVFTYHFGLQANGYVRNKLLN